MSHLLTVTTLCYQEIQFIRAWLENVLLFADRVLISEGGSTDGTLEVIAEYQRIHGDRIVVVPWSQSTTPEIDNYEEGARRNQLCNMVDEGFQVRLDVDEMLADNFRERITPYLDPDVCITGQWTNFWRSPHMIRIGTPSDEHWGPCPRYLLFPAGKVRFDDRTVHSHPHPSSAVKHLPDLIIYHYHYLLAYPKVKENRYGEWCGFWKPEISLGVFSGSHPSAISHLREEVNFGELVSHVNKLKRSRYAEKPK